MPIPHVTSRKAQIEVTLDGVTVVRPEPEATRLGTSRRVLLDWDDVTGAEIQTTSKGRSVIRLDVVGSTAAPHHRDDPLAVKVPRKQTEAAHRLVATINDEVAVRRRWRELQP